MSLTRDQKIAVFGVLATVVGIVLAHLDVPDSTLASRGAVAPEDAHSRTSDKQKAMPKPTTSEMRGGTAPPSQAPLTPPTDKHSAPAGNILPSAPQAGLSLTSPTHSESTSITVSFCPDVTSSYGTASVELWLRNSDTRGQIHVGTLNYGEPQTLSVSIPPGNYQIGGYVNGRRQIDAPNPVGLDLDTSFALGVIAWGNVTLPATVSSFKKVPCP